MKQELGQKWEKGTLGWARFYDSTGWNTNRVRNGYRWGKRDGKQSGGWNGDIWWGGDGNEIEREDVEIKLK